ncbi:MAG: hypothetical protein ABL933_15970 [Methyloglobulus sp.]
MIKPLLLMRSPAIVAGLFCVALFLSGCQTGKSPEAVTASFWQALAQGDLGKTVKQATENSRHLINLQAIDKYSTVNVGESTIEDEVATVETTISRNKRLVNFSTVLLKEQDAWKVDYLQTQMNISMIPFGEVVKSLQNLGVEFADQLQQQLPYIQREMESLGNELKNQIDQFGRSFGQPGNPGKPKPQPNPGTI